MSSWEPMQVRYKGFLCVFPPEYPTIDLFRGCQKCLATLKFCCGNKKELRKADIPKCEFNTVK